MLERASPSLAKPLQPKNEAELGRLRTKLAVAGFRSEAAGTIYLGLKFTGLRGRPVPWRRHICTSLYGVNQHSLEYPIASGRIAVLPARPGRVDFLGRSRKQAIFLALPDALDLMVVCVEAGLGLDQAMRKVADEMKKTYRILAEEFALSNFQLQMGRPRGEVLHELGARRACPTCGRWRPCSSRPTSSVRASPKRCARKAIPCESAAVNWPRKRPPRRRSS